MKSIKFLAAGLVVLMTAACSTSSPKGSAEVKKLYPSKAEIDSVSYLVGINFGGMIKQYNLGDLNMSQLEKGIKDILNAKGNPADSTYATQFKINPQEMQKVIGAYIQKMQQYTVALNLEEEKTYLEGIAKKENIQKTEDGILYLIENPGDAEKITDKDTLFVHYKGMLADGTVFDEIKPEAPSAKFTLSQVIQGWKQGMQLVGDHGKITLYLPSNLAYGEMGQPQAGIKPNSPLVFEVQVDSVKKYVAPVETATKK